VRQFTTQEIDTTLPYQLEAEAKGVLRWLVEGAVAWHRRVSKTQVKTGLGPCAAIDASVDQYRYDNDHASRFIEECLKIEVGVGRVSARDLYNIFSQWSLENGFDDLVSENIFSRRMEERGLKKKRTKAGVEYEDVAVASSTSTTF
jgi:phage/plasmid-associated DNA primase